MSSQVAHPPDEVVIGDRGVDPAGVAAVARVGAPVALDPTAHARMAAGAEALRRVAAAGGPVYGVTTGLGSRATEPVAAGEAAVETTGGADAGDGTRPAGYALRTIRGRATAVGSPLPTELVRAAMVVRLAGLSSGRAGASPAVAELLAAMLNAGVHPRVPRSGSIGASDLCLMAHVGLGLIGEGEAECDGEWMDAGAALHRAGLRPLSPGPRDGLAICSSSAVSAGAAALGLVDAGALLGCAQASAALSMEGFRAQLGPLDPRVAAARPAPGQAWASDGLRGLLRGGALEAPGAARRVQDPLSFRCAGQLHGALATALSWLADAVAPELAGGGDNPLVLAPADPAGPDLGPEPDEVVSTGNFQTSALALALDATAIAVAQVAHGIAERSARLAEARASGLPGGLIDPALPGAVTRSGVGPVGKTAHALVLEIRHAAAPLAIHPAIVASGIEDDSTGAAQAALRLRGQLSRLALLVAIELLVAAQAVDLAGVAGVLGAGTAAVHAAVRERVAPLGEDRPLGPEIERLEHDLVSGGGLLAAVGAALGPAGAGNAA